MENFARPSICVSRCLGFENCRYNGSMVSENLVHNLKEYVTFTTVCPETEIGLGVPRESLRIVKENTGLKLIQPKSGKDYTSAMNKFVEEFIYSLSGIDGFILKSRSPSCGVKDVKIYSGTGKGASSEKGSGFLGSRLSINYPFSAVEDEGRLSNFKLRENFLTRIFISAGLRQIENARCFNELQKFHSRNKLLIMSYSQKALKELGNLAANHDHQPFDILIRIYRQQLNKALSHCPRYTSVINVLQHAMGHFSKHITDAERAFLVDSIEKYRSGHVPVSAPLYLVKSYAVRFNLENLLNQSFFSPYPEALVEMRDSGKGIN